VTQQTGDELKKLVVSEYGRKGAADMASDYPY
jgi:hypothetical protein